MPYAVIDETKIRLNIVFANNTRRRTDGSWRRCYRCTVLDVMVKFLHGGPSIMVHLKPMLTNMAQDKFNIWFSIIQQLQNQGANTIGSITDGYKVNQKFIRLFPFLNGSRGHPLDSYNPWFYLFARVLLLKGIRDNLLIEKLRELELITGKIANWNDVIEADENKNEKF